MFDPSIYVVSVVGKSFQFITGMGFRSYDAGFDRIRIEAGST